MLEVGGMSLVRPHLVATPERNGWRTVWLVDEHGCALNTEPLCTVPSEYHSWFVDWLVKQKMPDEAMTLGLLWHPALGETSATRLAVEETR